ncbi:hypothetical protein [Pseudomonas sp. CGJS7]|uniref:hypothetical protein n=1 Tax=Pseudomonas sp. CGJS7 TaxID=3109348 RepID=UPI00300BE72F
MDVKSLCTALVLLAAVSGCKLDRVVRDDLPEWPWKAGEVCGAGPCAENHALNAWNEAGKFCNGYHLDSKKAAEHSKAARLGIKGVGAIAGAILVNVTTGSATKAWGSVAGAANSFGPQMDGLLNNAVGVNQRVSIENAIARWTPLYHQTNDAGTRVSIAMSLVHECAMSSAKAEQAVLDAISKATTSTAEKITPVPIAPAPAN